MNKFLILLCLFCSACTDFKEHPISSAAAATGRVMMGIGTVGMSEYQIQSAKNRDKEYSLKCISFGFKEGTTEYSKCRFELEKAYISKPVSSTQQPYKSTTHL